MWRSTNVLSPPLVAQLLKKRMLKCRLGSQNVLNCPLGWLNHDKAKRALKCPLKWREHTVSLPLPFCALHWWVDNDWIFIFVRTYSLIQLPKSPVDGLQAITPPPPQKRCKCFFLGKNHVQYLLRVNFRCQDIIVAAIAVISNLIPKINYVHPDRRDREISILSVILTSPL